jgi:hypothetical protein
MKKINKIAMAIISTLLLTTGCGDNSLSTQGREFIKTEINSDVKKLEYGIDKVQKNGFVDVELGESDVSILLTLMTKDKSKFILITEIMDPNKEVIYSVDIGEDGPTNIESDFVSSSYVGQGELTVFLPPTPNLKMKKGTYRFKFRGESTVLLRKAEAFIKSIKKGEEIDKLKYKIDMNVWVAEVSLLKNMESYKKKFIDSYKKTINRILAPHALSLDKINFYTANEEAVKKYTNLQEDMTGEACVEMNKVIGDSFALNLGVVNNLGVKGKQAAGLSPSPGNIMNRDSSESCFYVGYSAYEDNTTAGREMMGGNILHEGAHFLSLHHPTEGNGLTFDYINDTPECDLATYDGRDNDRDFENISIAGVTDGQIDDYECGLEGGARNFLFYSGVEHYLPFTMSNEQAKIFRRHPLTVRVK